MDFGIPAIATQMANMDTAQTMTVGSMRRGLRQMEQLSAALVQMMDNALMPPGFDSGTRVNIRI
jgi:hypothetical protein